MPMQIDFPLGTTVRTRHPAQQTIQEGIVVGYWWEKNAGLYVRFAGNPTVYSFSSRYVHDRQCMTLIRKGAGVKPN